jgi:hypothetical protein
MGDSRNPYKISSQWWSDDNCPPDFSIQLNQPTLLNVDVPHRVNTLGISDWRISYSIRFLGNPSWEETIDKLQPYILP